MYVGHFPLSDKQAAMMGGKTGSNLCPVMDFGISGVETLNSTTGEFVNCPLSCIYLISMTFLESSVLCLSGDQLS